MWLLFLACGDIAPSAPPLPPTYTVVRGDTLSRIAKREGTTVKELRSLNGIKGDRIEVGQVLTLASRSVPAPVKPTSSPVPRRRRAKVPHPDVAPPQDAAVDGPTVPTIAMPKKLRCLETRAGESDDSMVASAGLERVDVEQTLAAFAPRTGSCLVGLDPPPTTELPLVLTVGCDGRVTSVAIRGSHDWPDAHAQCLRQAHLRVGFPAHGLPDGDIVKYPIRLY